VVCPGDLCASLYYFQPPPFQIDGILGAAESLSLPPAARSASAWVSAVFDGPQVFAHPDHQSGPLLALQRQRYRAENDHCSRQVTTGLLLLLASCGWIVGGAEGAKRAIARGVPLCNRTPINGNAMLGPFTVRRLSPPEAPALFNEIELICRRAKLRRQPEIRVLTGQAAMNAYAQGTPDDAVVTVTEGLLRGMTTKEAAAILAHEIAHVCNDDGWTMNWAASLQRAINGVSADGLNSAAGCCAAVAQSSPFWLLKSAPAIAELLFLALSRFRELEADALALELTGDRKTLIGALAKLEYHHRAISGVPAGATEDRLSSYLRSHPLTAERICHIHALPINGLIGSA
jgi:heat shock protein HtpX